MFGAPPHGHGIYARGQEVSFLAQYDFVCLTSGRADAREKGRALKAQGKRLWIYQGAYDWGKSQWRAAQARCEALAEELGADGCIADCEMGWESASRADAEEMARSLVASRFRWGFTSYPMWRFLSAVGPIFRGKVWGNPQIYGRTSYVQAHGDLIRQKAIHGEWWGLWVNAFGAGMVIPAVAGWVAHESQSTPDGFRAYLETIPHSQGAIAWTTNNDPAFLTAVYKEWSPGGSSAGTALHFLRGLVATQTGRVVLALIAVAIVVAAVLTGWRYA